MDDSRSGETNVYPFRTQRYFCINGVWYFNTRGGGQRGPFATKQEMQGELLLFIREKTMENNRIVSS